MNKQQHNHRLKTDNSQSHFETGGGGGLKIILIGQIFDLDSAVAKHNVCSNHVDAFYYHGSPSGRQTSGTDQTMKY